MKTVFILFYTAWSLMAFSQGINRLNITVHLNDTIQKIRNIGASACWYAEEIGAQWPLVHKQRMAEALFSRTFDGTGKPKGIGLSAFRYNIGAGTAEQGDSSGIRDPSHRVECFLSANGQYNWNKQPGYTWMLTQAKKYGVENLIAFVNSPPVHFTKDGLGFKLEKDYITNLREDKYQAYANFLAEVVKHFDKINLHFNYISPVNEPQWDWTGIKGQAKQEGSPWTNEEIYNAVKALDHSLSQYKLSTKILVTEAGMLDHLYASNVKASKQLAAFWNPASALYIGGLSHITKFISGHGYFTDKGDGYLVAARARLRDSLKNYVTGLEYWQSEYCMLGDGYKENTTGKRSAIDCALFLAKVIHHDFTVGNATAWHYWNSFEPGPADSNTRYNLIALNSKRATDTAQRYFITKNLWALGHYSLFVRPGMYRVQTSTNDGSDELARAQKVMVSAFKNVANSNIIVNVINYTIEDAQITVVIDGLPESKKMRLVHHYVTSAKEGDDCKPYPFTKDGSVIVAPRTINTFVFSL